MATSTTPTATASEPLVELTRPQCLGLLRTRTLGRVVVVGSDGAPVVRPVSYAFDEASQSVVFRTAPGSKLYSLLRAGRATFEVDDIDETARRGWSVIIVGVAEEIAPPRELRPAGALPWSDGERTHWLRIRAGTVSGRQIALDGVAPVRPLTSRP